MDEAERCHRISYISYGKMIAEGTVEDVVRESGLVTYVIQGKGLEKIAIELQGADGVEQIAPFGASLHVVGSEPERLKKALRPYLQRPDIKVAPVETSLEDVFIKFMGSSSDNMAPENVKVDRP
jgi:ABC-2 type transport system ATP-binding protein